MEVSRTDLIAGYQGQTAHKVKEVIDRAKGGVLFIDEAYSITENDHSDSYGRECLTELTKALEDYREDLVVIVAGYTEPMKQFFESNPGLKSRFNTFVEFDDYNATELIEILKSISQSEDYIVSDGAIGMLYNRFNQMLHPKADEFANGRFVRNIFEDMVMNQARRVSKIDNPSLNELKELSELDVPEELLSKSHIDVC
jgi:SpoVK/Ycf46/Vps4 family AAA+-type ATPase